MIPLRVLLVEDSEQDSALLLRHLERAGYQVAYERVETAPEMACALEQKAWDVVLSDYVMPDFSALAALRLMRDQGLDLPFIVVSGQIGEDIAIEAMRAGAHDYIMKDNLKRLVPAITRELVEAENRRLRRQAEQDLKRSEAELRTLSRRLLQAQEDERHAIARELHDQMGQSLTVLGILLGKTKGYIGDSGRPWLEEATKVLSELANQMRSLSQSLRPGMLDDLGLVPALAWYFEDFKKRTGIAIDFNHSGLENKLSPDLNVTVYRIAQEALTNVLKYAGVTSARVTVANDGCRLYVEVEDQGNGFDLAGVAATCSGLRGIRERAYSLGGMAQVESCPGAGTVVSVELPLEPPAEKPGPG